MFEESLEQRQLVWHHFKNGAPGILTDGPYVLDKRDVWYMRNVNEQDAGYILRNCFDYENSLRDDYQFFECELCHQCLCLEEPKFITDCPVCSSKVCGDCSCGCEEPADWVNFNNGSRMKVTANPRTEKAWKDVRDTIDRETKKQYSYADGTPSFFPQPTDRPMTFDPFSIQGRSPTEWVNPPIGKTPGPGRFMHVDYGTNERSALSIKCLRCNYFQVIPLPLPKRVNYYRCANCGNGIEIVEDLF